VALGWPPAGDTWDARAADGVRDAVQHLENPGAACLLTGHGYRFEMWGIY
jgi:hypothetical protein